MPASPSFLDLNTGLPVGPGNNLYRPTSEQTVTTNQGQTGQQQSQTITQTNQTTTNYSNILNSTPEAVKALNELIRQLSDRPAITDAELDAQVPLLQRKYTRTGWMWIDPQTGSYVLPQDAQRVQNERLAERERLKKEAGVIRGGTEEQRATSEARSQEIKRTRSQQGDYSKDAAFADAQFLIDKAITDSLDKAMPGIVAASEGAGTSKGSFRALALQNAAQEGAIEGGALGAQLSVQYGQIFNQLESLLVELTKQDPNSPAALLLQALQASKGMVQTGVTSSNTSGTQVANTNTTTQQGPSTQNQNTNRQYGGEGGQPGMMTGLPMIEAANKTPPPPAVTANTVNPNANKPISGIYIFSMGDSGGADVGTFDTEKAYEDVVGESSNIDRGIVY